MSHAAVRIAYFSGRAGTAVSVRSGRENKVLTGSVELRESQESAGVLAVLDATNRWIEHN